MWRLPTCAWWVFGLESNRSMTWQNWEKVILSAPPVSFSHITRSSFSVASWPQRCILAATSPIEMAPSPSKSSIWKAVLYSASRSAGSPESSCLSQPRSAPSSWSSVASFAISKPSMLLASAVSGTKSSSASMTRPSSKSTDLDRWFTSAPPSERDTSSGDLLRFGLRSGDSTPPWKSPLGLPGFARRGRSAPAPAPCPWLGPKFS
mmetsp:Transcript_41028/g.112931  ORF Transcript_41028/g.112931 Transcript_41028/m.112931 type:complete len:206 (+) Transcript_41028:1788-2405(+)